MSGNIVGIDIGSVSVRAVELKNATKARPTIVRTHEVPLPDGSVRRGEVLEVQTVADAIKQLWSTGKFSTKNVVIGMGGPRVLSRDLRLPKGSMAQIRESLQFHVQDMLPVPVAEALLDFYPISEESTESGPMVNGLLVAAIKEAVSANIDAVTRAGLRPVQVDLIPFAVSRALAPVGISKGLCATLSIGANTTDVVITRDGVPQFVRIVAAGGDDITRALSSRLEMPRDAAEELKRELGLGSRNYGASQKPAVEIIYEVAGELLSSIRNTLAYFVNTKQSGPIERLVLSGGGGRLAGLDGILAQATGIPVESAAALTRIASARSAPEWSSTERAESMTTAFGLALGASA